MSPHRERGAPKHDSQQHERERNVQGGRDQGECGRECSKQDSDRDDQPHMIGFPDRPDRMIDQCPLLLAALAERKETPDPGAEISAAGQQVTGQRPHQRSAQH